MNNFTKKVSRKVADTFIFTKFSVHVFDLLYEKFPETYFVGGAVRNVLLGEKVTDSDIATSAPTKQVASILKMNGAKFSLVNEKFGVVVAYNDTKKIEITTFRKDHYADTRFPKITFAKDAKTDSLRRDFTINALYYQPARRKGFPKILDFHEGLEDIKKRQIKFIGNAQKRIEEDPLRIVRAHRFALQYNLEFEKETLAALQKNINLLKKVSKARVEREINSTASQKIRIALQKVIHNVS